MSNGARQVGDSAQVQVPPKPAHQHRFDNFWRHESDVAIEHIHDCLSRCGAVLVGPSRACRGIELEHEERAK